MSDDLRQRYVIGLGANLGDRHATLSSAVRALAEVGSVLAVSALYETQAVGPPQPDYLNAAVLLASGLLPHDVLGCLLTIERAHGRERRQRWGPRTLDLDLLYGPGLSLDDPTLTVPHPELPHRPFALAPLVDVLPDARDVHSGARYAELLAALGTTSIRRLGSTVAWPPPHASGRAE
jgi:2-amino-4-hydroxy-6-hydroxymethyldihydropteridine diphosphokinase